MARWRLAMGAVVVTAMLAAVSLGAAPRGAWGPGGGFGPGMMGRGLGQGGFDGQDLPALDRPLTVDTVPARVDAALKSWGYTNLVVGEVIDFSALRNAAGWMPMFRNQQAPGADTFYVLVKEKDTGKGALELLVDPRTGAVASEPGPSMMWSTKYGRMLYTGSTAAPIGVDKARQAARDFLAARGDTTAYDLDATEMYGYYTIHLVSGGKVVGMLGVNATTGAVWYHTWHGTFVAAKDIGK